MTPEEAQENLFPPRTKPPKLGGGPKLPGMESGEEAPEEKDTKRGKKKN